MSKDEKIFCICSGKELKRNINGNGQNKERRKDGVLYRGLCELSYLARQLPTLKDPKDFEEEVVNAITIIENMRKEIEKISEEETHKTVEGNGRGRYSSHHPAKKAIFGYNDLILPMDKEIHARLENNNVLIAEAMILSVREEVYGDINAEFINQDGQDLSRKAIADIVMRAEMNIRKIPPKTLRNKMIQKATPEVYAGKMANMLRSKGVRIEVKNKEQAQ